MKQCHHENILSLHCSFVHQENLWMVMPYVKGGSVLNIMKFAFPKVRPPPPLPAPLAQSPSLVAGKGDQIDSSQKAVWTCECLGARRRQEDQVVGLGLSRHAGCSRML